MKYLLALAVLMFTKGHGVETGRRRHRVAGWVFRNFPGQITCAEFEAFIHDYQDNALAPAQRALFERHMALCSQCRASLRGYVRTIELGQKLFHDSDGPVPAEVPDHVVAAVRAAMLEGDTDARP